MYKKTLISLILVSLVSFSLTNCTKDTDIELTKTDTFNISDLKLTDNNILQFDDYEQLKSSLNQLMGMDESDYKIWEKSIGFSSYFTERDMAWEILNKVKDQSELETILDQYGHFFNTTNIDGETHYVDAYQETSLLYVCNKDGLFQIGSYLYKVIDSYIVTSKIGNLNEIKTINKSNINQFRMNNDYKINSFVLNEKGATTYDHSYVRHKKREAWIEVFCRREYVQLPTPFGYILHTSHLSQIHAWGKKKTWCGWIKYKTNVRIEGCNTQWADMLMNVPSIISSNMLKYYNIPSEAKYTRDFRINLINRVDPGVFSSPFNFEIIQVKTKTTGTNNHWACINFI